MSFQDNPQRIAKGLAVGAPGAVRGSLALSSLAQAVNGGALVAGAHGVSKSGWREPVLLMAGAGAVVIAIATLAVAARLGARAEILMLIGVAMAALVGIAVLAMWLGQSRARLAARSGDVWRGVGNALPFLCCAVDASGRQVYANALFRDWFPDAEHAPLAALKNRLGGDNVAGDLLGRLAAGAARGIPLTEDCTVSAATGESCFSISAHPLDNGSGMVLWLVEDVTDRRRAAQATADQQSRLQDFLENAPIGCYSADSDGRLLLVNRALAGWLGYTPAEIASRKLTLHDFLARPVPRLLPIGPDGAKSAGGFEVGLRARNGETVQAFVSQTIVSDAMDGSWRTRSVVRDLTPEREWEQALKRSEQRFARFFEDAPVGIVLLDTEGRVTESNRAWRELTAPGETRTVGRRLTDLVADDEVGKVTTWIERVVAEAALATPIDVVLKTATEQGSPRIATMLVSRLTDARGAIYGLIVHFLEATEQRNLEAQFAQGQKMQAVGQLAGGVAHDFNNLLTAMIGFCDLLLLRHSPGDQSFADIMQIKQNANRAARLVRQLLAFSRQQTLQPRVLSLTDVLGDLSNLIRRLIGANIKLEMVHGRDLGPVRVDQGQLEQVVINLAVNARDAMAEGGKLTIRTTNRTLERSERRGAETIPPGDYVVLEVADTGIGIAAQHIEHIFEPFFTTKEVGAGTGLGLSTVYGIVKQTGGHVFVESERDKGTVFTIMLPRHIAAAGAVVAAKPDQHADAPGAPETTGFGTVLIVEDEDAVRLFSARALRAKGYKVLEARTGEAAMELFGVIDEPVDLMITDAVMPEMDGPTLIRIIRETRPELPVICISGYAEEAFRQRLGESTDIHFLPKPFSLAQLAGKVKEVMTG
jgi:two-component system, cell cycle sensor histidine kinase and response regulator CckA